MILTKDQLRELYEPYIELLREKREEIRWSKSETARAAELSDKYVHLIETGQRLPALDTLLVLLGIVGLERHVRENLVEEVLDTVDALLEEDLSW